MPIVAFLLIAATLVLTYVVGVTLSVRYRALRRLYDDQLVVANERSISTRWLARYLSLAGFRRSGAPALYIAATAAAVGAGLVAGQIYRVALVASLIEMVANVPGGVGEVLAV